MSWRRGVQGSVSYIAPHPLKRLNLVQHEYEPRAPRIPKHRQETGKEAQGGIVVNVSLDPGVSLHGRRYMRLPSEPGEEPFRISEAPFRLGPAVGPKDRTEGRCCSGDALKAPLGQLCGRGEERGLVGLRKPRQRRGPPPRG
jgi:hypothetical protein